MLRYTSIVAFSCCLVLCVGYKVGNGAACGPKEEMQCIHSCPPQVTCRNRFIGTSCLLTDETCDNVCVCKPGLVRNDAGECVPEEQCDTCPGAHEFFECGSACDNECATLATQNRTHCPIKNIVCNRKCYCLDGYARDQSGNCIPVEKCHNHDSIKPKEDTRVRRHSLTHPSCTDENEVYTDCKKNCPPDTCLSLVARFKCDGSEPCKKGCVCKPGYLRQDINSPCKPICKCDEMKNSGDCKEQS
uniref:TIL domain-containing protein n=1 Tax=Heliothis virescens TaxID=7102 RepID=A0A2A4JJI9_HELVI